MLKYIGLRIFMPLAGRFPRVFYGLAFIAGWAVWKTNGSMRRRVQSNMLPACDGDRRRANREGLKALRNVARYYVDLATLPRRDIANFERDHITIVNGGGLAVLAQPGPMIVMSAHMGDPELAVQALTVRGRPFVALVEALRPQPVADYLLGLRSAGGAKFYEADFRGLRACVDTLKDGGLLGLVGDRDIKGTGVCVTMLGREVKLPGGPWELARRTGATVLPVFCARRGMDDMTVFVEDALRVNQEGDAETAVREAVQAWATILERQIRREPGQWTVLEDYWKVHGCG